MIRVRSRATIVHEIDTESRRFGFASLSEAVRSVMTIFARSSDVQAAVRKDFALRIDHTEER